MNIRGIARKDRKTKNLAKRINPGEIAIIKHLDIDEIAAISLVEAKIKAVVNFDKTISGKYPNQGPQILEEAKIPIFECRDEGFLEDFEDGEEIEIEKGKFRYKDIELDCEYLDKHRIKELLDIGYDNIEDELDKFIENTLEYAKREKGIVLGHVDIPKVKTKMKNRHVLVVVRGRDYKKDLMAMNNYINDVNPIIIAVDGGGDALLDFGYVPDMVIGDMDSVSDKCLRATKEIVVHAYPDGRAPGKKRIDELGLESTIFCAPGTSEDLAFLLAYENEANLIVALGTHNSMIDFLEKGRPGMSSTFLVRLKIGDMLVDAKGVNQLYRSSLKPKYMIFLVLAALIPIIMVSLLYPPIIEILQLLQMKIRLLLGL